MEYKLASGSTWADCSTTDTAVVAGNYVVRYKATGSAFVGAETGPLTVTAPILTISIGFDFDDISIQRSSENDTISRGADGSKPTSLTLSVSSAAGYTGVQWYVDGNTAAPVGAGNTITLTAAAYDIRNHSVTFTGVKDGIPYSQLIPFKVVQ
jgi:hypothetical protein